MIDIVKVQLRKLWIALKCLTKFVYFHFFSMMALGEKGNI